MASKKGKEKAVEESESEARRVPSDDEDEDMRAVPTRRDSFSDEDEEFGSSARPSAAPSGSGDVKMDDFDNEIAFSDTEDDENDPVVKRLPVYYTPHYVSSLALLQFLDKQPRPNTAHPLLPPSMRPDDYDAFNDEIDEADRKIKAKYKPKSQYLQLEVPIEHHGPRVWDERSKELAEGLYDEEDEAPKKRGRKSAADEEETRRRKEEAKEAREKLRVKSIKFESTVVPNTTNYLVAVVKHDQVHLTPLTQTFQMRPKLDYIDQAARNKRRLARKAKQAADDDDSDEEISDTDLRKEAKAVQVTVKQNSDAKPVAVGGTTARASANLFDPHRLRDSEDWIDLEHFDSSTAQASIAFSEMTVELEKQDAKLVSATKPLQYLS